MNSSNHKSTNTSERLRRLTAISVFCALAYICVFLIRFKVSFLTFDLKDAVMAIGAMYFGPAAGVAMPIAVSLLEFLTVSDTGIYGLIMNVISSVTFSFVASFIYRFRKSLGGAAISLVSAAAVTTAVMMGANLLVTPYYTGMPVGDIRAMIPTLLLPFNLTKFVFNAALVMLLYKRFSQILKSAGVVRVAGEGTVGTPMSKAVQIAVAAVSALIVVGALLYLFLKLGGAVNFGISDILG